jgi:hypothetical protein
MDGDLLLSNWMVTVTLGGEGKMKINDATPERQRMDPLWGSVGEKSGG